MFYQVQNLAKIINYIQQLLLDEECPQLNPFNDFEYQVTPEGRDFVKDGEYSGVY